MKYNVGIVGCGSIFKRHVDSIINSKKYNLVAICDIQEELVVNIAKKYSVKPYTSLEKMIENEDINFVSINTPNSTHYSQSIYCLNNKCDVLVEKPVAFSTKEILEIKKVADKNKQNAYCVLQVRKNPTIQLFKEVLNMGLIGKIRSVSLIQRWQRPLEYFNGWRSIPSIGGGILYEVGIHYLDVLQYLFGVPNVHSSKVYTTKHHNIGIEDTVYSIFDFGEFGGTCEITIAAEPHNLECSLSIIGSNGFIKIGGKALNIIESTNFLSHGAKIQFENISKKYSINVNPNEYGSYIGSCPNHPLVYDNLDDFKIEESINVVNLINEIYLKNNIKYERNEN